MSITGQKANKKGHNSTSGCFSIKKKTVIRIYLITGWIMIALILMTATGAVSYDDIKYFFWTVPVLTAVLYLLYINGRPYRMPEEGIKSILALVFTFVCLIFAFFASILLDH